MIKSLILDGILGGLTALVRSTFSWGVVGWRRSAATMNESMRGSGPFCRRVSGA